jgi:hypothetical protein
MLEEGTPERQEEAHRKKVSRFLLLRKEGK